MPQQGWDRLLSDVPEASEREEAFELRRGTERIAKQVLGALRRLDLDQAAQGISGARLEGNAYWPEELARQAGA